MKRSEGLVEFLEVVEVGSFSGAARNLGVSVAHISRQISALESRLETRLFVRTTRRVSPTMAGEQLALRSRPLLEELSRAQESLLVANESEEGSVRLSGGHFVEQLVVPLMAEFCEAHPRIRIEVDLSNRNVDLLAGQIDFVVGAVPVENSPALVARPFMDVPMVTLASLALVRQLETNLGAPLAPTMVPENRCLSLSGHPWRFRRNEKTHVIEPAGPFFSNSAQVLIGAATAGLGLIHVRAYYAPDMCRLHDLVPVFGDWLTDDSILYGIVYARNRFMPSRVRLLIDHLLTSRVHRINCRKRRGSD